MGEEVPGLAQRCAELVDAAVHGPWPSEGEVEACGEGLLEAVGEPETEEAWHAAWMPVAAAIAARFRARASEWNAVVRYTDTLFGRIVTPRQHPRQVPNVRMGEGAGAKFIVRLPVVDQVAVALLKDAKAPERLAFVAAMEDSMVFLAVLRGLPSWGPTQPEVVALAVRVFEQFKRDMMLGEFLVPFRVWASEAPEEARALVEAWLDRAVDAHTLPPSVVQLLIEGVVVAREEGWEAWRDGVVRRLVDSVNVTRRDLGPLVACFAWPEDRPVPEARHARMLELVAAGPPSAVLSGLRAMGREASSAETAAEALRTSCTLVGLAGAATHEGSDLASLHVLVAGVLTRALFQLPAASYEGARPDIDALLNVLLAMEVQPGRHALDGCLMALAEQDRGRAEAFLLAWLERHGQAVMQSGKTVRDWFPVGFDAIAAKRSVLGWWLRLMAGRSLPLRAMGGQSVSALRGAWAIGQEEVDWLRGLEVERLHGLCHEIAAHLPRNSAWVGVLFDLGRHVPSALRFATAVICEDGVAEWPHACQERLASWQTSMTEIPEDHRQSLVDAGGQVSITLEPFRRLFDSAYRHPPELESMTPANEESWRREQRRMAEAMRDAEGQSIWRQFAQEVPILRGSKVTMGEGVETEMRSIHGTVSVPMRARFDPITSWQRRLWHSSRAAELLGEEDAV